MEHFYFLLVVISHARHTISLFFLIHLASSKKMISTLGNIVEK